jgi:hypothetical protein
MEMPAGWVDVLASGLLPLVNLFILPALVLLLLGVTLSEMGLSLPGLQRYRLLTYFLLVIHSIILIIELFPLFSTGDSLTWFSDISSPGAGFWLTQFISKGCLASFLFGIILFPLYRRFGFHALTIISVPFCMVHFIGPLGLALLSIPMGLGLGYLSLRTQSVTCTVLIYSLLGTLLNALNLYL